MNESKVEKKKENRMKRYTVWEKKDGWAGKRWQTEARTPEERKNRKKMKEERGKPTDTTGN